VSTAERRLLQRALGLLRADPATADAATRADALWLMRVLPDDDAPEAAATPPDESGGGQPPPAGPPESSPAAAGGNDAGGGGASAAPRPSSETTSLFVQQAGAGDDLQLHARRIPVPAADALPGRAAFERALRPFMRRRPSRTRHAVDAEATAEASAQASADALLAAGPARAVPALVPVLRPVRERWFDLVLLAEQDDTMRVFEDTLRELRQLLARHGAFRRVGLWRWSARDGAIQTQTATGMPCAPHAMLQGQQPQLVWVLTHGASSRWNGDPLRGFVRDLAARSVVAVVQLMPEKSWGATVLGPSRDRVRSRERAAPNNQLLRRARWTGAWTRDRACDALPLLSLQDESVARWAEFVMSPRAMEHPAIDLGRRAVATRHNAAAPTAEPDAAIRERVLRFRSIASPRAFALLRLLSGAWITLPVMRLLLQSLPGPQALTPMAEVLLSGLLRRSSEAGVRTEELSFDFEPNVREWLSGSLSGDERRDLDQAMAESKEAIRRFVEKRLNRTLSSFGALLLDPEGVELLPASAKSFVEVSRKLRALRGVSVTAQAAPATSAIPAAATAPASPRELRTIRLLHLANLHIGRDHPASDWRRRPGMGEPWLQNLREIGPVDIVCVTGDIAMTGLPEQYEEAARFIDETLGALHLGKDRLFCVPGNHDIDRRARSPYADELLRTPFDSIDEDLLLRDMRTRQAAFHAWQRRVSTARADDGPAYLTQVDLGKGDRLGILGLDTAWLAGLDSKGTLRVGRLQRQQAAAARLPGVPAIALMHHPFEELIDGEALDAQLVEAGIHLVLDGHRYAADGTDWSKTASGLLVASTGGLYGTPQVQVLDLALYRDVPGEPDRLETALVSTRAWSTVQQLWHTKDRGDPRMEGRRGTARSGNAEAPGDPSRLFVGRRLELNELDISLLQGEFRNPVVIVGERRVGKTALAFEFRDQHWRRSMEPATDGPGLGEDTFITFGAPDHGDIGHAVDLGRLIARRLGIEVTDGAMWKQLDAKLQERPRLLFFDDIASGAMQRAIEELHARLPFQRILGAAVQLPLGIRWKTLHLQGLSFDESLALVSAHFAELSGHRIPGREAEALARIGDGHPGALRMAITMWHEGERLKVIEEEVGSWLRNLQSMDDPADAAVPSETRTTRLFVSCAVSDAQEVGQLLRQLRLHGYDPAHSLVGDIKSDLEWQQQVAPALREADVVLVCLSSRTDDMRGYFGREIDLAIETARARPDPALIVPLRLDRCTMPARLQDRQRLDFFASNGLEVLLAMLADAGKGRHGTAPARRPSVFLSYAREDVKAVRKLARRLEDIGFECLWLDVNDRVGSDEAAARIEAGMRDCDFFMPVLSTAADERSGRYWNEWHAAIANATHSGTRLLPLVIDRRMPRKTTYRRIFKDATVALGDLVLMHAPGGEVDRPLEAKLAALLASVDRTTRKGDRG